jgi:hypothetical protein
MPTDPNDTTGMKSSQVYRYLKKRETEKEGAHKRASASRGVTDVNAMARYLYGDSLLAAQQDPRVRSALIAQQRSAIPAAGATAWLAQKHGDGRPQPGVNMANEFTPIVQGQYGTSQDTQAMGFHPMDQLEYTRTQQQPYLQQALLRMLLKQQGQPNVRRF